MATLKVSREDVYKAIDSERDYQDSRWGEKLSGERPADADEGGNRTLDEFIMYIAGYSNKLVEIGATSSDQRSKLNYVRKVAGLCVAAMEQHGAPHREAFPKQ